MARGDNLTPHQWQPGQSGNPAGRPKGRSLTAILAAVLDATELDGEPIPGGRTVGEALVEAAVKKALAGDVAMFRELVRRRDGDHCRMGYSPTVERLRDTGDPLADLLRSPFAGHDDGE